MNYEFKLIIKNQDGSEYVKIGDILECPGGDEEKKLLTNVEVHMDTVDENVKQRANAILARVKIVGNLDKILAERAKKIFDWAINYNDDAWYKDVEIEMSTSATVSVPIRTYIIPNMFVVDYKETYNAEGESSHFELYLTQKDGNMQKIKNFN